MPGDNGHPYLHADSRYAIVEDPQTAQLKGALLKDIQRSIYVYRVDCGGSNGYRQHRFKQELCELAAEMVCDIQVAHYPPGCSKYNPIEHRMFCHVSRSLRAVVLKTIQVAKAFIARTTSATGLRVVAEIARRNYERGVKATREFIDNSPIKFDKRLPQLNYTAPWCTPQ